MSIKRNPFLAKCQTLGFDQSIYFAYWALGRHHELLFKYKSNCFHKNYHNVLPQPLWCKTISLHNSLPLPSHFFSSHSFQTKQRLLLPV